MNFIDKLKEKFSNTSVKSVNKSSLVKQLHEELTNYDEEKLVNELLKEFEIIVGEDSVHELMIKKNKYERIGMLKCKEYVELCEEIEEITDKKIRKEKLIKEANEIERIKMDYPFYKFITKEKVTEVCEKYGLVRAPIEFYTDSIPDNMLNKVMQFEVNKHNILKEKDIIDIPYFFINRPTAALQSCKANSLVILAPPNMMNVPSRLGMDYDNCTFINMETPQIINDDPIVLQPIKGGYLIICAWGGPEASDENIINEKFN